MVMGKWNGSMNGWNEWLILNSITTSHYYRMPCRHLHHHQYHNHNHLFSLFVLAAVRYTIVIIVSCFVPISYLCHHHHHHLSSLYNNVHVLLLNTLQVIYYHHVHFFRTWRSIILSLLLMLLIACIRFVCPLDFRELFHRHPFRWAYVPMYMYKTFPCHILREWSWVEERIIVHNGNGQVK